MFCHLPIWCGSYEVLKSWIRSIYIEYSHSREESLILGFDWKSIFITAQLISFQNWQNLCWRLKLVPATNKSELPHVCSSLCLFFSWIPQFTWKLCKIWWNLAYPRFIFSYIFCLSLKYFGRKWSEVTSFLWMEINSARWLKFMCFPKNFLLSNPKSGAACHNKAFLPRLLPKEGEQFFSHWWYWGGFFVYCEILKFLRGWRW